MSATHTPGPWIFEPHNGYGSSDPDGVPWPIGYVSKAAFEPLIALEDVLGRNSDEMVCNARLIAAAPKLLDAAIDALAGWRYIRQQYGDLPGVGWDRVEAALTAAIARAAEVTP